MTNFNDDEFTGILAEVARRASVDTDFRSLALENPRAAMQEMTSHELPADVEVKFLDNSGRIKYFPLPDLIPGLEELSEAELLAIAGGDYGVSVTGGTGTAAAGGKWQR